MTALPPNHHADYPQFSGLRGFLGGLSMTVLRGNDARFICEQAGVTAEDHVVDIGCGPGAAARTAARRGATSIGLDPSSAMLRWAKLLTVVPKPKGKVQWVEAGAEATTLPDESVTVSWTIMALHHWPDLDGGLKEAARILEPGGRWLGLEKKCEPGATGNASHGWTPAQAELLGTMLPDYGFSEVTVGEHRVGSRDMLLVSATR